MLIFVAMSPRSSRFFTVNDRPPVIDASPCKNPRLAQEAFDVAVIVATMIIASIRYDEQSFSRVACSFHLAHPQIHCVKERRHSFWRAEKQAVLQFLNAACKHRRQFRAIGEIHKEK